MNKKQDILNKPALISFDQFFSQEQEKILPNTLSLVKSVIVYLATRDGFRETLTIGHIVTYGNSSKRSIDSEWLRIPKCGKKALELIDKWLGSFDLHRGMKL